MSEFKTITGEIAAVPPFDFAKSLAYLREFGPSWGDFTQDDTTHTRALMIDGQTVLVAIRARDQSPGIAYTLYADSSVSASTRAAVEERIRRFLSLDDDLTSFYALADDDPAFAPIVRSLYGYHQVLFLSPFECAVWAILSQRNQFPIALKMKAALMQHYGDALTYNGFTYRSFPEPSRMAVVSVDEAVAVVGHKVKGALLPGLARAFDSMDEMWLREAPYVEAERWLKSIRGIGDWSSRFILLRGAGRVEDIPRGEKRIQDAVARAYGLVHAAEEDVQSLAKPYGEWVGYWAHYLRAVL